MSPEIVVYDTHGNPLVRAKLPNYDRDTIERLKPVAMTLGERVILEADVVDGRPIEVGGFILREDKITDSFNAELSAQTS